MSQPPYPPQGEPPRDPYVDPTGYPPAPPAPQEGWGAVPTYSPPGAVGPAPYADWIKRVGGYLVDVALLIPAYLVMIVGAGIMGSGGAGDTNPVGLFLYFLGFLAALGLMIWNMLIRQGRTGWSVGKQVIGIRLISEKTGQPIGAGLNFVRMLAHMLDSLACYLGWLWPLWDAKRQTFADKIMGTIVIVQKPG